MSSTLQEEADLGEFFDFHSAVSDPCQLSHTAESELSTAVPALENEESEAQLAADFSNFSKWIPRFIQPDGPCAYCRDRRLNCYLSYGKVTCTACDTLFRPCSFVKSHSHEASDIPEESSTMGLIDTLHSVAEDHCQEQGELTGVRPLKSKPDGSKKSVSRFSRAAIKVLREWLDAHVSNPYPTEDEKAQLGHTTGLRVAQINTWLANARRRGKVGAKNKSILDGLPQPSSVSLPPTAAIGIPNSTAIEINKWEDMNPLERWKHSPPQNEPAPFNAIADALGRKDLPDYAEELSPSSTLGWQGLGSSRDDSRCSNRRAASVTSLEQSTSHSAVSSAAWSGSRESLGSYSSFGSNLSGRKERRRRRKTSTTVLKKPSNDKTAKRDRIFQCTFCTDTFMTKYDWTRHEKTLHLSLEKYICCPLGPQTLDSASGQIICAYCCAPDPTKDHIESHNHRQCVEKGFDGRTFFRKDHLRQHLKLVHDSKLLPHMEDWKTNLANVNSRCGFCSQRFSSWSERNDHIAAHFKNGSRMNEWTGCRGLDPAIAALVNSAMPPYLIGIETSTVNPFSATQPDQCVSFQLPHEGGGPTTCWEVLTVRLGQFAKEQTDQGIVLTDEELQKQARRILFDSDDAWDHTAADNPEWLDLFKRAHALDFIPSEVSGRGRNMAADLEMYTDLGMRIPFDVQLEQLSEVNAAMSGLCEQDMACCQVEDAMDYNKLLTDQELSGVVDFTTTTSQDGLFATADQFGLQNGIGFEGEVTDTMMQDLDMFGDMDFSVGFD